MPTPRVQNAGNFMETGTFIVSTVKVFTSPRIISPMLAFYIHIIGSYLSQSKHCLCCIVAHRRRNQDQTKSVMLLLNTFLSQISLKIREFSVKCGRVGDQEKMRKSLAKCGRVSISATVNAICYYLRQVSVFFLFNLAV